MTGRIRICRYDRTYTLSLTCPACGAATVTAHPARFSPQDRLGSYRRMVR
jgi:H/ACA ribonucleoprotein complex subunit 3